jgi:hypothetical protein
MEGQFRDLALFNLAIDSKLRGCDVVALRVEDVAPSGFAVDRATVRQKKTGHSVRFELTEQTRQSADDYVKATGRKPGEFLFCSRRDHRRYMMDPAIRSAPRKLDREDRSRAALLRNAIALTGPKQP